MLCPVNDDFVGRGGGESMNLQSHHFGGNKWNPLEPSIQKKCICRKYKETMLFKKKTKNKLLKMIASASENTSPLSQCYIISSPNRTNHQDYEDGEQTGGGQELRMLGGAGGIRERPPWWWASSVSQLRWWWDKSHLHIWSTVTALHRHD